MNINATIAHNIFEILTTSSKDTEKVQCSKCNSEKVIKVISAGSFRLDFRSINPVLLPHLAVEQNLVFPERHENGFRENSSLATLLYFSFLGCCFEKS